MLIQCKTLLLKHKYLDDWFLSRYGMNLYRGCQHACEYCDGRSRRYYVHEDFGGQVAVKVNAPQVLAKEPVEVMVHQGRLREIPGVGPVIERLVVEMVETGACEYYHQLAPWS